MQSLRLTVRVKIVISYCTAERMFLLGLPGYWPEHLHDYIDRGYMKIFLAEVVSTSCLDISIAHYHNFGSI